jgi:hypothetical protein
LAEVGKISLASGLALEVLYGKLILGSHELSIKGMKSRLAKPRNSGYEMAEITVNGISDRK